MPAVRAADEWRKVLEVLLQQQQVGGSDSRCCINTRPVKFNNSLDSNNTLDICFWVLIALNSARLKRRWRVSGNSGRKVMLAACWTLPVLQSRTPRGKHSVHCLSIPYRPPVVKVLIPNTPTVWGEQVGLWEELQAGLKLGLKQGTPLTGLFVDPSIINTWQKKSSLVRNL